ncbi:uncharacterized protein BXZ73DRAFT_105197 [Epithele typhae]|uniref:uncharacterized protein n=1 Tax=Epithele typhae TaxID=378194 RepID=UPI0020081F09|nr:uncharacterized protein BXZ73DRAFT_105197 [Epithele typhae]KAH9918563.1 hypothetical protein BXZ73DRAFT_105197 [Epithele typhae]
MSASPQPAPTPALADPSGSPMPPSQLADMLSKAFRETEALKSELMTMTRRAEKAERLLAAFQTSAQTPPASPPAQGAPQPQISDAARKAIMECEHRAECAERARDEADARLQMIREAWTALNTFFSRTEKDSIQARNSFALAVAEGGVQVLQVSHIPTQPSPSFHHALPPPASSHPSHRASGSSARATGRASISSQPFPSVSLPPPPSATGSRVRPRSGSMEYAAPLSGPGAPPPAKRPRSEREDDRGPAHGHSLSPSNSPLPAYPNGHSTDRSPQLSVRHAPPQPGLHPHYSYPGPHPHDDIRYAHGDHPQPRRPRSTSRGRSSRSGSRGSSMSLDDMLIDAATADGMPPQQLQGPRGRSSSPSRADYHMRGRAAIHVHSSHPGMALQGGSLSGQTQTTHIFMTPQTGPSVKKPKLGVLASNGSIMTMGPNGSIISGPATIGGGGFPATNDQGQRICRQCGLAGRYKDGKCVEKWGPGPEGPGTVCDRCRKKMKRVERRGTLDSMSLNAHLHNQPLAIHPSGAPQAAPGSYTNGRSSHSGSDRSVHRTDTLPIHSSHSSRAPGLNGLSSSAVYSRQDRDRDYDRENGASPYHRSSHRGPTPPGIATLPQDDEYDRRRHPSSAHKPNGSMNGHARSSSSRSATRSPRPKPAAATKNTGRGSSRGSKSSASDTMDADAEGEDADADADADDAEAEADEVVDGDADADAEFLLAADATERNTSTDEEWLKKEDA